MPTIRKIARRPRNGGTAQFTPAYEALMFSIYYAAITSMEDDDVLSNFGSTKGELNLKYRLGLEQALARADFLNVPDLVLIQAFAIFLSLVRRHDSPRFVWMMTGLLIRMAQALGLQRDGTYFKHLTPFEVEMRRRVWYSICGLDVRASEDQGTDFTIPYSSFDTKLPLNINDDDISVDTKETPKEREGITDTTPAIFAMEVSNISRQMMLPGVGIEEQNRLIATIYATLEHRLLRFKPNLENIIYWTVIVITRLMCAKLTLLSHLPTLFSTPSPSPSSPSLGDQASDEKGFRNKLLAAAIEVAEFNHALNAEKAARQWRWIFQTYSHWHAIVYLLLDICRRPWSAMVERAWIALHGPWLIPAQPKSSNPDAPDKDKDLRTWVPLRRLMLKARNHRHAELERLCGDVSAAQQLEIDDRRLPVPETDGTVSSLAVADKFRDIWRALVGLRNDTEGPAQSFVPQQHTPPTTAQITDPSHPFYLPGSSANQIPTTRYTASTSPSQSQSGTISHNYSQPPQPNTDWSNTHENSWFWAPNTDANMFPGGDELMDMDMNLDLDGSDMNWHDWVESARGTEMNTSHL
ncbi:fungal-specific transcription factor domain-containing protein [Poronia punctata]|nr:fungal-specific transcription factor domain-containing protein [Poronia punctata]